MTYDTFVIYIASIVSFILGCVVTTKYHISYDVLYLCPYCNKYHYIKPSRKGADT